MERSKEELDLLIKKFDHDVATKSRGLRLALVIDQFFAVLFYNASQDETISSHIGRRIESGTATWVDKKLCCFLRWLEKSHCFISKGE